MGGGEREPRAAENHQKSFLQASALAEPSCPVGGFCRCSTAIASLLGSRPSPIPSPPCLHSQSVSILGRGQQLRVVLRGQRYASPRWTPSSGLCGRAAQQEDQAPVAPLVMAVLGCFFSCWL